jgi:phospholipase/carboxylesterase
MPTQEIKTGLPAPKPRAMKPRAMKVHAGGRLSPLSQPAGKEAVRPGLSRVLKGQRGRDAWLYVPEEHKRFLPLLVLLHGASGNAQQMLEHFQGPAEVHGVALLLPESRGNTWDLLQGGLGQDLVFIDKAIAAVSGLFPVDAKHFGIGGFSDGASYALSLGIANGDQFSHILAFSPGCMLVPVIRGYPPTFMAHGLEDHVQNIELCSRRVVETLRQEKVDLRYREFPDGHTIPRDLAAEALGWFSQGPGATQERKLG